MPRFTFRLNPATRWSTEADNLEDAILELRADLERDIVELNVILDDPRKHLIPNKED